MENGLGGIAGTQNDICEPELINRKPLLATILILFGIGYTIDYNSMSLYFIRRPVLTHSASQTPQKRSPLDCMEMNALA